MKRILLGGDAHLQQGKEPDISYQLFKKVCSSLKPNQIILGGDILDMEFIGHFATVGQQEGKRLSETLNILRGELAFFKKYSKEQIIFLQGNHEERLDRFLDSQPVLKGSVDFEGIFDNLNIKYIPLNQQPYKFLPNLYICHGMFYNQYFTKKHIELLGKSCINFHTHRVQQYVNSYPTGEIMQGIGAGSLTETVEYYCKGRTVPNHSHSFIELLIDEESERWQANNIIVNSDENKAWCIINNKLFETEKQVSLE